MIQFLADSRCSDYGAGKRFFDDRIDAKRASAGGIRREISDVLHGADALSAFIRKTVNSVLGSSPFAFRSNVSAPFRSSFGKMVTVAVAPARHPAIVSDAGTSWNL